MSQDKEEPVFKDTLDEQDDEQTNEVKELNETANQLMQLNKPYLLTGKQSPSTKSKNLQKSLSMQDIYGLSIMPFMKDYGNCKTKIS